MTTATGCNLKQQHALHVGRLQSLQGTKYTFGTEADFRHYPCRLLLDEEAIMKKTASTDEPADEGCMFPMDGSGEKPGRKRALYNINVHAAPELYGP